MENFTEDAFLQKFDVHDFIDRITSSVEGGGIRGGSELFNSRMMENFLDQTLEKLYKLENGVNQNIQDSLEKYYVSLTPFISKSNDLEDKLNDIADVHKNLSSSVEIAVNRVGNLGDQLESISQPYNRMLTSLNTIENFELFLHSDEVPSFLLVRDNLKQLLVNTKIVQNLYNFSCCLSDEKFLCVKENIEVCLKNVHLMIFEHFSSAFNTNDYDTMLQCYDCLSGTTAANECIEIFVTLCFEKWLYKEDLFNTIFDCIKNCSLITEKIFNKYSELVYNSLVRKIFEEYLKNYVNYLLSNKNDMRDYLRQLCLIYKQCGDMNKKILSLKLLYETRSVDIYMRAIFSPYLSTYINDEITLFNKKCSDKVNIQNKSSMIIEEIVITLLQYSFESVERCIVLVSSNELFNCMIKLFRILHNNLLINLIDKGLQLAIQDIPLKDPKNTPSLAFLRNVEKAVICTHLYEKHYSSNILPYICSYDGISDISIMVSNGIKDIEKKIDWGLDSIITSVINWCRHLFYEQKKEDFLINDDQQSLICTPTQTCVNVCNFIRGVFEEVAHSLDSNSLSFNAEFGIRFLRLYTDHLLQKQYNCLGAMRLLCEVKNYRELFLRSNILKIDQVFQLLSSLVELLIIQPSNVNDLLKSDDLIYVERSILQSFVQQRTDFKSNKLATLFL